MYRVTVTFVIASLLLGCTFAAKEMGSTPGTSSTEPGQKKSANGKLTKPATEFVTVRDPVEDCFTVKVPKGWFTRAYSSRAFDIHREVVISVSPNRDTVVFMGDPNIPQYWTPEYAENNPVLQQIVEVNRMVKISEYVPAEQYLPDYIQRKFGKLEGFKLGELTRNEKRVEDFKKAFADAGVPFGAGDAADQDFTYTDHGTKMSARVVCITIQTSAFWMADVGGITTAGKPADFEQMTRTMAKSKKTNPEWTARQAAQHQQRMAEMQAFSDRMTAQHNRNMAWIQASAESHQRRMESMWAASDASVKSFFERSAASDLQQQRFLNYINDENTVSDSAGKTWQVATGYDRYFVNKETGKYLGGDINFDSEAIRRMGLNPDDYTETKIRE